MLLSKIDTLYKRLATYHLYVTCKIVTLSHSFEPFLGTLFRNQFFSHKQKMFHVKHFNSTMKTRRNKIMYASQLSWEQDFLNIRLDEIYS